MFVVDTQQNAPSTVGVSTEPAGLAYSVVPIIY